MHVHGTRRGPLLPLRLLTGLAVAALAGLGGCGPDDAAAPAQPVRGELARFAGLSGTLDIAGGTAHIPVMEAAARRIMEANPQIRITVAGGGSGVGVQKVGEGLVDIGNTGRPVSDAEREKYGIASFPFAVDGVAVVVHPKNPIDGLPSAQARDAFAGRITDWAELGDLEGEIHLYGRDEASGTREVFWTALLGKGAIADTTNVVTSNGAMKTAVARDELALGYLSIGHVDETVKALPIDGVAPTQESAKSGTYEVTRQLYMNTRGEPAPLARAFIDYVLSPEGAAWIEEAGYIPLPR